MMRQLAQKEQKKEMDPRSPIWKYFEKILENGVLVKAKCTL